MATTTRGILDALVPVIDAVAVADPTSQDDRFRTLIGQRVALRGSRAVVLSATGGRRVNAGQTCSDYETQITIDVYYVDPQGRSLGRAIADSEAIIEAIYSWQSTNNIDVSKIDPDLAVASLVDDGDLLMSRTARVVFQWGA